MWLDIKWVEWLCRNGYNGYIANSDVGLAPELFLCTWRDHVEYVGTYDTKQIIQMPFADSIYSKQVFYIGPL
jgi:hypothetical protein